jgi:nitrite reductase/ring-hydroxylating ferredoxin subunit
MPGFVRAAGVAEIPPGTAKEVAVEGKPVALYNVGGVFYATSNICLHRGGPLGQGMLDGAIVMCPWHAWTWDVTTGENASNPVLKIETYAVKVEGEDVLVQVE